MCGYAAVNQPQIMDKKIKCLILLYFSCMCFCNFVVSPDSRFAISGMLLPCAAKQTTEQSKSYCFYKN